MTSRIYELCAKLFRDEFYEFYSKPRMVFTNWLNEKTGLQESYLMNPVFATQHWLEQLEYMNHQRGKK